MKYVLIFTLLCLGLASCEKETVCDSLAWRAQREPLTDAEVAYVAKECKSDKDL